MQRSPFKTTIQDKTESESAFKTNINICHSKIQNVGKGKQTFFYIYSGPKLYQKRRNMLFSLPNNLTLWKWDELRNFSLFARSLAAQKIKVWQFTRVIRVMGSHLRWQRYLWGGGGGGGGGQVERRNEMALMNFCQLQGYWVWPHAPIALSIMKRVIFPSKDISGAKCGRWSRGGN